jgi:hypothetical protein
MTTEPQGGWRDLPPIDEAERAAVEIGREPSQTFLGWFDVCRRAAFLYAKYHGGAGSHQMDRGTAFHEAVAELTRELVERGENSIPPELGLDRLNEVFERRLDLQVPAYERDQLRGMIYNWCVGSFFQPDRVIGVEQELTLEVGEWTIRCRVDLIEQPAHWMLDVIDYKTQKAMPRTGADEEWATGGFDDNGNPRFGGNFQTQVYALAVAFGQTAAGVNLGAGVERFRVFLRFPQYLYEEGLGYRDAVIDRGQLLNFRLDLESQLRGLAESIETGKWQPKPGNHCQRCPAKYECPLPPVLRPESQLADVDDPARIETLAANWHFMADRASDLKKRIGPAAERLGMTVEYRGEQRCGVYIGDNLALVYVPYERESLKQGHLPKIREGIEGAVEYGQPFELKDHVSHSQGTEFVKRKVAPRRREGGDDGRSTD